MAEITVRPGPLHDAGGDCDLAAGQFGVVKRQFAEAEGAPGEARMGTMLSAAAARECIASWHETYREANRVMRALDGMLRGTAAVVVAGDQDAAGLYRGPIPDLPVIDVDLAE